MPIADVLSRVATIQQLAGASLTPAAPSTSFADTLAAVDPTSTPGASSQLAEEAGLASAALSPLALDDGSGATPLPGASVGGALGATALPYWLSQLASTQSAAPVNGTGTGARALAAAESQLGVAEQPPGSNDGPQLATYRSAVAGAQSGEPWCAYFASWAAQQAGAPIGANGEGLGSVAQIADWASSTGRLLPAGSTPQPGDLILFGDRHVGLVESVNADGTLTTVEGNYANAVSRVNRSPAEATGYVRL